MTNEKEALILSVYERHDDLVRQYNNLKSKFFCVSAWRYTHPYSGFCQGSKDEGITPSI